MFYMACPKCRRKVSEESMGYRCETCQQSVEAAVPTYNFSFMLSDYSSKVTVQCLGEVGEAILGVPARKLYEEEGLSQNIGKDRQFT